MNVLGLIASDTGGHPAACLLRDGRLIAFAEEERFIRVKQAAGYFPSHAVRFCLERAGLRLGAVDLLAFGWDATAYRWRFPLFLAASFVRQRVQGAFAPRAPLQEGRPSLGSALAAGVRSLVGYHPRALTEKIVIGLRDAGQDTAKVPPIVFVKHHRAHAASAFYSSGLQESAVLVFDGHGEENAITIWRGDGPRLTLIQEIDIPHSLGWFYSAFTEYLGWSPDEGEVKLMGLAPFGAPDPAIVRHVERMLALTADGVRVDATQLFYGRRSHGARFGDAVVRALGPPRGVDEPITDRHRAIAWAVQRRLEEAGLHLARRALRLSGSANLCLAGGVALNCKMNGEIHRRGIARRLFVQPLAHDAGVALGAAQAVAMQHGDESRCLLDHLYWGPDYGNDAIEAVLHRNRIPFRRPPDIAAAAARLIAAGQIVGWFQGRMEAGPRALGARSILGDPSRPEMKDLINDRVKLRESWRPFALSILEEHAGEYLQRPGPSPFMIVAHDVVPGKEPAIASAMHAIDKTTRPQTVSRATNPRFWSLIDGFRRLTGTPAVLNTSFNVKNEPIVCAPADAVRCFFGTGMDALAIGDFLVEKAGGGRGAE
ncbi:MAG TPA: carbamoyltransferase C-terminal domain-containing protein [Polyangia bacterium]|jgi:carbamoyltransferase